MSKVGTGTVTFQKSELELGNGTVKIVTVPQHCLEGLVYFDVVIEDGDLMIMPPLEGFVMNRVTGDYFETLLYKIFVSMDEQTTVGEMASLLQVELVILPFL